MEKRYTDERNIQILISLLKKHDIKDIVVNPGATNVSFVASIQNDDFFNIYSCVDERSACYMACGIAEELGKPVVITCTGATASRNYVSGLTEAFYNKIPIIAITATQYIGRVGHNIPQVIDRSVQLNDIVKKSVQLHSIHTKEDEWACNVKVNDVLLECRRNGGGPVHINLETTYSNELTCTKLPDERIINRVNRQNELPIINAQKIAVFIGNHKKMTKELVEKIDKFCEKYNAIVLCDHTSNYYGKYKIIGNLICNQHGSNDLMYVDLLIHLGDISGAYLTVVPNEVWRINPDGIIRDTFKKLTYIFEMEEIDFFSSYIEDIITNENTSYYNEWKKEEKRLIEKLNNIELPFSNIWISKYIIEKIPNDSIVHLAILNTLRSWNFFNTDKVINCYCNTGGFGIDGILSTAMGNSLVTEKNVFCIIGDLAFFYDMNALGNRDIKNNLRVLLINNGCGIEFHNYNHRAVEVAKNGNINLEYIAADGHFGNKSKELVKNYSTNLGFKYLSATNKEEFYEKIDEFISEESTKPIVFEVFTNSEDESNALETINKLDKNLKSIVKDVVGENGIKKIKKILGK